MIDALVIAMLVAIAANLVWFWRNNPSRWKYVWLAFIALFFALEILGAFSGNTLSENLARYVPLPISIGGTIVACIILVLHWIDLARRK